MRKFAADRPYAEPEKATRKLLEIDGRIYIERINAAFLAAGGSPAEYRVGLARAIAQRLAVAA